ncbi:MULTISPECIES: MTH1187 family thiamine-binding protein [unclassified Megasphaera]|uniref:MTH1187 family thiamine-binding protein n=1 Tax=unclassified Megasphaera TaxID=2626256 RepID=UPI00094E689C|nr:MULTISPECIES: MTH1187 family thiamine-binding protein [unclassified Megasphaera]HAM04671.1 thiamine-binding protein [Megasphaera sp.]
MNTLVAVCIAPSGTGDEYAPYVAEVVKIIRNSGLKCHTYSMFTEIEGEWDDVMAVVKKSTQYFTDKGIRTSVVLKADIRPGYTNMMDGKIDRLNKAIEGK